MGAWIWGEQGSSLEPFFGGGGEVDCLSRAPPGPPRKAVVGEIRHVGVGRLWRSMLADLHGTYIENVGGNS